MKLQDSLGPGYSHKRNRINLSYRASPGLFFNPFKKDESILCHSHFVLRRRYPRPQTQRRPKIMQSTPHRTQMLTKYHLVYGSKDTEVKILLMQRTNSGKKTYRKIYKG
jgi:hypothetical protein